MRTLLCSMLFATAAACAATTPQADDATTKANAAKVTQCNGLVTVLRGDGKEVTAAEANQDPAGLPTLAAAYTKMDGDLGKTSVSDPALVDFSTKFRAMIQALTKDVNAIHDAAAAKDQAKTDAAVKQYQADKAKQPEMLASLKQTCQAARAAVAASAQGAAKKSDESNDDALDDMHSAPPPPEQPR